MAASVVATWSGTLAPAVTTSPLPPVQESLQIPVTGFGGGDWVVVIATWLTETQGTNITVSVGDDAQNWYDPLGTTTSTSGVTRTAAWYSPAAQVMGNVMIAPSGYVTAIAACVLEVNGLTPWPSPTAIRAVFANNSTTLSSMSVTPSGSTFMVTACGSDLNTATITHTGSGWTSITPVVASNGIDHTQDLTLTPFWQVASSATSTFSSSAALDMSGITAGTLVTVSAPTQPTAYWPVTIFEVAPAAGFATTPDETTWVQVTNPQRFLGFSMQQGKQYELDQLQAGTGSVLLDDPDGALITPGSGSYAGIGSATPARLRMAWQGGAWQVQFHGDGTTASPQLDSLAIFPVTAGQTYTVNAYLACSSTYVSGVTLKIRYNDGSSTTFTSPAVTGTIPVLVVASGTAPAGATAARILVVGAGTPPSSMIFSVAAGPPLAGASGGIVVPPAISWTGDNNATVTTLAPWKWDRRGAPSITPWSMVFNGYFERLPPQWDSSTYRGYTQATIVDAWNYITGNLQPVLFGEVLLDLPVAYWTLTDPQGSPTASNIAPGSSIGPLVSVNSKYGPGGSTGVFGQNTGALLGAQGTLLLQSSVRAQAQSGMWQMTLGTPALATFELGKSLALPGTAGLPSFTNGFTFECWFQVTQTSEITGPPIAVGEPVIWELLNNAGNGLILQVNTAGNLVLNGQTADTQFNYADMTELVHCVVYTTRTSFKVYINGQLSHSGTYSASAGYPGTMPTHFYNIALDGPYLTWGAVGVNVSYFGGYLAHVALYDYELSPLRIATHYQAGQLGMVGDSSAGRIERLLALGSYGGRRVILQETGQNISDMASCQDISGQPATTSINNVVQSTTPALAFVATTGDLVYIPRQYAWNKPVTWTLGEYEWQGEIPYVNAEFDNDPTKVVNSIQITQLDDQSVVVPDVDESASQAQYGILTDWFTGYLENDADSDLTAGPSLEDLANYLATTYAAADLRVNTVVVDAAAHPAAWPLVLTIQPGDMVTVNRRPPTATGEVITVTGRCIQVQRNMSWASGTATATITLDFAPEQTALTLNDPVLGLLNGQNILGW